MDPAITTTANEDSKTSAHFALAKYMDSLYCTYYDRINSAEWHEKVTNRQKYREEVALLQEHSGNSKSTRKRINYLSQLIQHDEAEAQDIEENMKTWLLRSAKQYMECLRLHGNGELSTYEDLTTTAVVRLLGLLLKNPNNHQLHEAVRQKLPELHVKLFVPFVQQISSALFENSVELQSTFSRLLIMMLKLSPHVCLPSILLLSRDSLEIENHDGASLATGESTYGRSSPNTVGNSIASQILKQFKNSSRLCESMLSSYENVAEAYIILAEWFPNNSTTKRPRERRKSLAVGKVHSGFEAYIHGWSACINAADLSQGLVSIWTGGNRSNAPDEALPKLTAISKSFKILGGLSRPKLIECYDVDGNTYTQIVKAGDDMRQDEVVEQAFTVLNYLLRRDHKCRDRKLILRTYNIAPLSSNVGVIEFAGTNTTAIGDFLLKAHTRLRPNDKPAAKVSETLRNALTKSSKSRIKSYISECKSSNLVCTMKWLCWMP